MMEQLLTTNGDVQYFKYHIKVNPKYKSLSYLALKRYFENEYELIASDSDIASEIFDRDYADYCYDHNIKPCDITLRLIKKEARD